MEDELLDELDELFGNEEPDFEEPEDLESLVEQMQQELLEIREQLAEHFDEESVPSAQQLAEDETFVHLLSCEVDPKTSFMAAYGEQLLRQAEEMQAQEGAAGFCPGYVNVGDVFDMDDDQIRKIAKMAQRGKRISF